MIMITESKRKNISKAIAILLGVLIAAGVLFCVFFLSAEANHTCTDEECPICAIIQMCEHILQRLGSGIAAVAVTGTIAVILVMALYTFWFVVSHTSLISLKIRLNP